MTEENNPEEQPAGEIPPSAKKRKSAGRTLVRALAYSIFFIFLLIVSAGLVLEYFFPAEKVRLIVEDKLSKQLKLPFKVQKIGFSLFSGLQLDNIALGSEPLAHIKQVVLDYDLTQLLQGKLVINQILIDHPQITVVAKNGVWNFLPLLELGNSPRAAKDKTKDKTDDLPAFPLAEIDIKELIIRNASARLDQNGKLRAHVDGLSLEAQGKASLRNIDLQLKVLLQPGKDKKPNIGFQDNGRMNFQSRVTTDLNFSANSLDRFLASGVLGLQNTRASIGDSSLPSPDVAVEMDTEVSLKPETLNLKNFRISLNHKNHIQVSGKLVNVSKDPSFQFMIHEATFQLKELLRWGKQWAPPLTGHGLLQAEAVNINGELSGSALKNLNINGGTLSTKNLWLNYPSHNIQLEDMNTRLKLKEISLHESNLKKASISINMRLEKGVAQKVEIKNWTQSLSLKAKGSDEILLAFNTDIKSFHFDHPETREIFLPVHAEGSGHLIKSDLNNLKLSYRLGTLASGMATGALKDFGKGSIKFDQNLTMNLAEVAGKLPKKFTALLTKDVIGTAQAKTSITGQLDAKFIPTQLRGTADFELAGLTAGLKEPALNIKNLNTRISFPLEFYSDKGVRIQNLDIHAELQGAEAPKTWKVNSLNLDTKIATQAFHNLRADFGTLPVQVDTRVALGNVSNHQPALSLTDLKIDFNMKADLLSDDVRNTRVKGKLSFKNLAALEILKSGDWVSRFNLDVHGKSLTRIRLSQKTQINKPSINQNGLELGLKSVSLESKSRQNLKEGEMNIDSFLFQSPDLVNARLKATLKDWGQSFDMEGAITNLQMGSIWNQLSAPDMENIKVDGDMEITLKAKGQLPAFDDKNRVTPPLWSQLLVPANVNERASLEMQAGIQLRDGFVEDSAQKILGENLTTQISLTLKNGRGDLSGNFSGKLTDPTRLGEISLNPEFKFSYGLDDMNTFRIKHHHLFFKNNGVEHNLEGSIKGLKPFITLQRQVGIQEFLSRLDINLTNKNSIDINQATTANLGELPGGIKTQGIIASEINLNQSAGKLLSMNGNIGFDNFNIRLPSGVALKNLSGTFPFTKTLILDVEQLKEKPSRFFPAQKKFFTPLRDFSRYKNIIRADALEVKEQALKNIGLDVVFKDNQLMAEKFIFDVLGGSVGGNLFLIQDQEGPVLKFSTEFAGIDSTKLFVKNKEIDAKVDGNLQIELKIKTGAEGQPVSLDQLNINIAITRIGSQTLDQLLLFLDPEESKPAIMDTRAKLKLAAPHQVQISLKNGNLNVEVWLKSDLLGIFKAPELKRVPVAALKRFNTIHEHLQSLKDLQQISNYLSARGLQFEDDKMTLRY